MEILHSAFQMIPGAHDDEGDSIAKELFDVGGVSLGAYPEEFRASGIQSAHVDREIIKKLIIRTHANSTTKLFLVLFSSGLITKEN
jgi:hypothetical protein